MATLMTYLTFDRTKEAVKYYEKVFGATNIGLVPATEDVCKTMGIEENFEDYVMHGTFSVLDNMILCADTFGKNVAFTDAMSLLLDFNSEDKKDMEKLENLYKLVTNHEDTEILMPLEEQFWGGKMGMIKDKYGITWSLHAQPYSKLNNN